MGKLETLATALAFAVLVGWGGRLLDAVSDVDPFCGSISFIDAQIMAANAGVTFDEAKRCAPAN
jgi:hypothetical protein